MTLDEWHAVLATEPATALQVGAIHGEFRRLGYRPGDRRERLAISASFLDIGELGSTRQLRMGEAGRLLAILRGCRCRDDLPVPVCRPPRRRSGRPGIAAPETRARTPTLAELLARLLAARLPAC